MGVRGKDWKLTAQIRRFSDPKHTVLGLEFSWGQGGWRRNGGAGRRLELKAQIHRFAVPKHMVLGLEFSLGQGGWRSTGGVEGGLEAEGSNP